MVSLGFMHAVAPTMFTFYNEMLDLDERHRISTLEPFDEFEEWHEKSIHYTITIAGKGIFAGTPWVRNINSRFVILSYCVYQLSALGVTIGFGNLNANIFVAHTSLRYEIWSCR